jgi:hypothetical protein
VRREPVGVLVGQSESVHDPADQISARANNVNELNDSASGPSSGSYRRLLRQAATVRLM